MRLNPLNGTTLFKILDPPLNTLCDGSSTHGGHTREKLWSVLCILQLYTSYTPQDVSLANGSLNWTSLHLQLLGTEKALHLFYIFAIDFRHTWWLKELPDGTCMLSIRRGSLLAFSSTACTIAVFHTCLVPNGLVPRYGNGSGNDIKKKM